jgi:hypothetical protein
MPAHAHSSAEHPNMREPCPTRHRGVFGTERRLRALVDPGLGSIEPPVKSQVRGMGVQLGWSRPVGRSPSLSDAHSARASNWPVVSSAQDGTRSDGMSGPRETPKRAVAESVRAAFGSFQLSGRPDQAVVLIRSGRGLGRPFVLVACLDRRTMPSAGTAIRIGIGAPVWSLAFMRSRHGLRPADRLAP